jgi:aspartate-semialdehyde dehydrogenase
MYECAVLGGSGFVGQRFVKMLENHELFKLGAVTGNSTKGKTLRDIWEIDTKLPRKFAGKKIQAVNQIGDAEIIFSALPNSEKTQEIEEKLADEGRYVFSNAGCMRMQKKMPLVVAEVNGSDLAMMHKHGEGGICKNANCSTIEYVLALKPIQDEWGIEQANIITMQAISGAGKGAYPKGVMDNSMVCRIPNEANKMKTEALKILHADFKISARCHRVPIQDGHMESIQVKTKKPIRYIDDVVEAMRVFHPLKGLIPTAPEPLYVFEDIEEEDLPKYDRSTYRPEHRLDLYKGNGMTVSVGQLEWDELFDIGFTILGHNTVRGAAGSSVQNAELFVSQYKNI